MTTETKDERSTVSDQVRLHQDARMAVCTELGTNETDLIDEIIRLRAERDAAVAAITRIRELHHDNGTELGLRPWCGYCQKAYPCPTIAAAAVGVADTTEADQ